MGKQRVVARRPRPSCGHRTLQECPLTVRDWEAVFFAYLGFLHTARLIAEQAHDRATKSRTEPEAVEP